MHNDELIEKEKRRRYLAFKRMRTLDETNELHELDKLLSPTDLFLVMYDEIQQLKKDKHRLDWCIREEPSFHHSEDEWICGHNFEKSFSCPRKAIDAAMEIIP